ncbi:MAG: bifunctional oligoribonuclease/PAP phosphatase NrnA [Deltaproteobacteria bacterium]|nr:bifunctional oligoribonuclease/PAP phosphatase NrnA [Deltaproteobacteria bacterium]
MSYKQVIEEINKSKRFIVVSHVSPEPDAVGSLLGLSLALKGMGKEVVPYLEDPLPDLCNFMPGNEIIVHSLKGEKPVDCTIAVDCGQLNRLGDGLVEFEGKGTIINIDHHATNNNFGEINIIDPKASAAGEMVYDLLKEAGAKITKEIATNLYVAIHTDTGSFRYDSATPGAFKRAGELVELGASPWEASRYLYEEYPKERFEMLSRVLSTLKLYEGGKVASLCVTLKMLKEVGATKDIVDGFVNFARSIKGVEVGVLVRENAPGEQKVSMRSKGKVNISSLAQVFGGGGHANAAGFTIKGEVEPTVIKVVDAVKDILKKQG